jgi:hypothetical protein
MNRISHAYPVTVKLKRQPSDDKYGPEATAMIEFLDSIQRSFRDSMEDCMKKGTLPSDIEFTGRFIIEGNSLDKIEKIV